MSANAPIPLELADRLGEELAALLRPVVAQVVVVGSVRRRASEVHDVEVLAMPLVGGPQPDLFGELRPTTLSLAEHVGQHTGGPGSRWKRVSGKAEAKIIRLKHLPSDTSAEIYVADEPRAWGPHLVVRTGPRAFGVSLMMRAKAQGKFFADGFLLHAHPRASQEPRCSDGPNCPFILDLQTEPSVFQALGMRWIAPEDRR